MKIKLIIEVEYPSAELDDIQKSLVRGNLERHLQRMMDKGSLLVESHLDGDDVYDFNVECMIDE